MHAEKRAWVRGNGGILDLRKKIAVVEWEKEFTPLLLSNAVKST
jgi:hypothetical protein